MLHSPKRFSDRVYVTTTPALPFLLMCALLAFSSLGFASSILLDPSSQAVPPGSTAVVQIGFSRAGDLYPQFLAAYDIQMYYDPALLTLLSVTHGDPVYGNQLDLSGFGTLVFDDTTTPGFVRLMELSFDSPLTLQEYQLDHFGLASLLFQTHGSGQSPLTLEVNMLTDAFGAAIEPTVPIGSITVGAGVPEPAMFVLFGSGLAALGLWSRRRRSH